MGSLNHEEYFDIWRLMGDCCQPKLLFSTTMILHMTLFSTMSI